MQAVLAMQDGRLQQSFDLVTGRTGGPGPAGPCDGGRREVQVVAADHGRCVQRRGGDPAGVGRGRLRRGAPGPLVLAAREGGDRGDLGDHRPLRLDPSEGDGRSRRRLGGRLPGTPAVAGRVVALPAPGLRAAPPDDRLNREAAAGAWPTAPAMATLPNTGRPRRRKWCQEMVSGNGVGERFPNSTRRDLHPSLHSRFLRPANVFGTASNQTQTKLQRNREEKPTAHSCSKTQSYLQMSRTADILFRF